MLMLVHCKQGIHFHNSSGSDFSIKSTGQDLRNVLHAEHFLKERKLSVHLLKVVCSCTRGLRNSSSLSLRR